MAQSNSVNFLWAIISVKMLITNKITLVTIYIIKRRFSFWGKKRFVNNVSIIKNVRSERIERRPMALQIM